MSAGPLTLDRLREAVTGDAAAFRCRRRLQPAGGPGDKVFPPTFEGARYALEQRRVPGRDELVRCVLLDSVQSQANRMEVALQDAMNAGRLQIPRVDVDFSDYDPCPEVTRGGASVRLTDAVGTVTSLQLPHRLADAVLRDSELDGVPFRDSDLGKTINDAKQTNATPLFALCPTALVFGMWDSTGPKGGLGSKFERAIVSEVVGIGAETGDLRRGVRRDPLEIRAAVKVKKLDSGEWCVAGDEKKGVVSPSQINHSSVPFPKKGDKKGNENYFDGVTIEYAEQVTTLSLICLRRLQFPINGSSQDATDDSARVVLAALGICSATLAFETGMGLRSRCLLWPDGPMEWELLDKPGKVPPRFRITAEDGIALLHEAIDARDSKLPWTVPPVILKPSAQLVRLTQLSQLAATKDSPGQDG